MTKRQGTAIAAVVILAFAATISFAAEPDPADLLKRSYAAETRACFTGRLRTTLHVGSSRASAEVRMHRSGRRSRIEYLTGPAAGSTIVDTGTSVIRLYNSTRTASVTQTPQRPEDLSLTLANYRPILAGTAKVAGRTCHIVRLAPRYPGNPSKKLWIDSASSVALRTERYGSDGKITMSSEFTEVDFSAKPTDSLFATPRGWKSTRSPGTPDTGSPNAVQKIVGFMPIKPGYVPRGYSFDGYSVCNTCQQACSAALRYSNGLNTVSVFERKGDCPMHGRGYGRGRGAGRGRGSGDCMMLDNPHARMLQTTARGLTVYLVGDIAEKELRMMADSLK